MTPTTQFLLLYLLGLALALGGIAWAWAQGPGDALLEGWRLPAVGGIVALGPLVATLAALWVQVPMPRQWLTILLGRGYYVEAYLGTGLWLPALVLFLLGPPAIGAIGLLRAGEGRWAVAGALLAIGTPTVYVLWGLYYRVASMPIYLWTQGPVARADHVLYIIYLVPFTIGWYAIGRRAALGDRRRLVWTTVCWSSIIVQTVAFVWYTRQVLMG